MSQNLELISIVAYTIASVSFVFGLILSIHFKIINVINDLTGKTARKAIAESRAKKEAKNKKTKNASVDITNNYTENLETGLLNYNESNFNELDATEPLDFQNDLLIESDYTVDLLNEDVSVAKRICNIQLEMIEEVMIIHTNETI